MRSMARQPATPPTGASRPALLLHPGIAWEPFPEFPVCRLPRRAAIVEQRFRRALPAVAGTEGTHGRPIRWCSKDPLDGRGDRSRITIGNRRSHTCRSDVFRQRVAPGEDARQSGPEIVEHACAEREIRLDVVQVRAHAHVSVEEVRTSPVVRDPARIEEHVRSGEPEAVALRARNRVATRISGISGFG